MAADIDIINAGLSKLGEQAILAVTDPSPPGRLANRTYADIRDALLREFPWNFATKRASLAADPVAPEWGFTTKYNLPGDCLRLVEINNLGDDDWRNEGRTIVTNKEAPLEIIYVGSAAVDVMDATFREALAARLAMEWAEPLSQTSSVVAAMSTLYRNKLRVARVADGQEDSTREVVAASFIESRFHGSGIRTPPPGSGTPL